MEESRRRLLKDTPEPLTDDDKIIAGDRLTVLVQAQAIGSERDAAWRAFAIDLTSFVCNWHPDLGCGLKCRPAADCIVASSSLFARKRPSRGTSPQLEGYKRASSVQRPSLCRRASGALRVGHLELCIECEGLSSNSVRRRMGWSRCVIISSRAAWALVSSVDVLAAIADVRFWSLAFMQPQFHTRVSAKAASTTLSCEECGVRFISRN